MTYSAPYSAFLIFLVVLGLLYNAMVSIMLVARANHPTIKAISPTFSLLIILGCTISYVSVFLFTGEPTQAACVARPFLPAIAFGMVFGMLSLKNYRIYAIFSNARRMDESLSNTSLIARFGSVIVLVEVVLCAIWAGVSPLSPTVVVNSSVNVVTTCQSVDPATASALATLLYLFNVALLGSSVYIAYQTRHAGEKFNESKEMSNAIYATILPLMVGLPLVYVQTLDYVTINVLTCLMLILCPAAVSITLFGGKLYTLYIQPLFKKSNAYDMGNSIFARAATTDGAGVGGKNFGDVSQSGLSFWQFQQRKKRVGATWVTCVVAVMPELNWIVSVDDITVTQVKVYESLKLSECQLVDGETPETCTIKHPSGEYNLEHKSKDMMARFKKIFARAQQGAQDLGAAGPIKTTSTASSAVEDV